MERNQSEELSPRRIVTPPASPVNLRGGKTYTVKKSNLTPTAANDVTSDVTRTVLQTMWSTLTSREDAAASKVRIRSVIEEHVGVEKASALVGLLSECVRMRCSFEELEARCITISRHSLPLLPLLLLQLSQI